MLVRPLAGVVVDVGRYDLIIQLESNALVSAQKRPGFNIGSKCWVSYDFTRGEVRHIFADDPTLKAKQDTTEAVDVAGEHGEDNDPVEADEYAVSGALSPCSDGWGFWDSDSGVLEFS